MPLGISPGGVERLDGGVRGGVRVSGQDAGIALLQACYPVLLVQIRDQEFTCEFIPIKRSVAGSVGWNGKAQGTVVTWWGRNALQALLTDVRKAEGGACFNPFFECTQINISNYCCVLWPAGMLSFILRLCSQGTKTVSSPTRIMVCISWNNYLQSKDIRPRLTVADADFSPIPQSLRCIYGVLQGEWVSYLKITVENSVLRHRQ